MSSAHTLTGSILTSTVCTPMCAGSPSTAEVSASGRGPRGDGLALGPGTHVTLNGIPPPVLMKDRCKLFCRVAGNTAYYQLRDRVVDGTPCGQDTNDICVQGLCRVSPRWRFLPGAVPLTNGVCGFLDRAATAPLCARCPEQGFSKCGPWTSMSCGKYPLILTRALSTF